jgi:hypothetical protein
LREKHASAGWSVFGEPLHKRYRYCSRQAVHATCSRQALQRQFRDAHAVNSHLAFNFDAAGPIMDAWRLACRPKI